MDNPEKHDNSETFSVDRRELMKLGAGTVMAAALAVPSASAQQGAGVPQGPVPAPGSMRGPGEIAPFTGPGYTYNPNRIGKNGPVDDTTARIVKWVHDFDGSLVTPPVVEMFNRTIIDTMASVIAGFEFEAPRILARIASRHYPAGVEKCTILGYGVTTTPEMATFANATLMRETDFNDNMVLGGHVSNIISAALAMGEALHKSGREVMNAICIGYELTTAPIGGTPVAAAMMAGKLMGLDEDHLANALALALTPAFQGPVRGFGVLNMWKSVCQTQPVGDGVWAAMYAREGMTCNPQPYEGRGAYWSFQARTGGGALQPNGMGREFSLPTRAGRLEIEWNHWFKRRPAEANTQGILLIMPEIRAWVGNPNDIASVHWDDSYANWGETSDAPRWDPQNRQTADHSWPYVFSRALLDGDIYLDSYTDEKLMDPAVRAIMNKMTSAPVLGWDGLGAGRLTITKTSGETKYWDTYNGVRVLDIKDYMPMTKEEVKAKFDRVCAFRKVTDTQRDQAYKVWGNLSDVKDFADAMKVLAKFGQPKPL